MVYSNVCASRGEVTKIYSEYSELEREWLLERTEQTWQDFEAWLIGRAQIRQKALDLWLRRLRRGSNRTA
jgi:hypothetical protein